MTFYGYIYINLKQNAVLNFFITVVLFIPVTLAAQAGLSVNGEPVTTDCVKIQSIDGTLDTVKAKRVTIYNAEIINNCLEIGIIIGNCKADIELITDHKLIESQSLKLNFLLKYKEPCFCEGNIAYSRTRC